MTLTFTLNEGSLQILIPSRWFVRRGQFFKHNLLKSSLNKIYRVFFNIYCHFLFVGHIRNLYFSDIGVLRSHWSLEEISCPISNLFCLWKNYTPSESPPMSNMHPRVQALSGPSVAYSRQANIGQSSDVPLMDHVC